VKITGSISLQNDDCVITIGSQRFSLAYTSANGFGPVVMQDQVWFSSRSGPPRFNSFRVLAQRHRNHLLRSLLIGIGRGCRDLWLRSEAFEELFIGLADVALKGMPTQGFVMLKVVPYYRFRLAGLLLSRIILGIVTTYRNAEDDKQADMDRAPQISLKK